MLERTGISLVATLSVLFGDSSKTELVLADLDEKNESEEFKKGTPKEFDLPDFAIVPEKEKTELKSPRVPPFNSNIYHLFHPSVPTPPPDRLV